ncbi:hypothetical protein QVD99_001721 [Batrachochytrium dendrobatidis]|nr:hypothetical protein O5D80_000368 [Batrachochytrium dendrobatidis]KAK5671895.1 hypothetical protein QVD99_001721 [Batrachochytrium dendrobatidis]
MKPEDQSIQSILAAQNRHSLEIDRQIEIDRLRRNKIKEEVHVLILGSGDSGKTTFLKQIKILYGGAYKETERKACRFQILKNIRESVMAIIAFLNFDGSMDDFSHLKKSIQVVSEHLKQQEPDGVCNISANCAVEIEMLWKDPKLQEYLKELDRTELQLQDTAGYFLSQASKYIPESYLPVNDDIVRIRSPTSQITESIYTIEGSVFHFFDVGGQLKHRKQWAPYFDHVSTIIFVVSLACYDQNLAEDATVNRMHDALELFEGVCNNPLLKKISVTLFLNKKDLFETKIATVPINNYFPDFLELNTTLKKGSKFFDKKFRYTLLDDETGSDHQRNVFTYVTCCTDTNTMEIIILTVMSSIMQKNLSSIGLQ